MPDLFSSLESKYNIRMGSGLATVKNAKEPFVDTSDAEVPPPTKIKVKKKKIVRKQSTEPNVVSVETSTTTSTSSVFGKLREVQKKGFIVTKTNQFNFLQQQLLKLLVQQPLLLMKVPNHQTHQQQ